MFVAIFTHSAVKQKEFTKKYTKSTEFFTKKKEIGNRLEHINPAQSAPALQPFLEKRKTHNFALFFLKLFVR
jgi:hypothetical protein